jgi:hypothetical protein
VVWKSWRLPRFAYTGVISRYAIVRKDHTGTKIRKLIWLGEAVKVSELYQLATLQTVSFRPEDQEAMRFHPPYPVVPSTMSDRTIWNTRRGSRKLWRAIVLNLSPCCEDTKVLVLYM